MPIDDGTTTHIAAVPSTDGDPDDLYCVLSDARRRFVIACLAEDTAPVKLRDVADRVRSRDGAASGSTSGTVSVLATLYHVHVPLMEDADVVEFDGDENAVRLTERGDELAADLGVARQHRGLSP